MLIKIADRRKGLALRHPQVVATAAAPPLPRPLVAVPRIESRGRRLLLVSGSSSTKGCERSHLESAQPPPPHQHSLTFAATTSSFTSRGSGGRALKPRPTREAAAATRAAFATADIRRALARLAQQQQQPAMRHFELDCKGASGQEQAEEKSFSSRRDEHDDERAAQVAAGAQWTAATSCLGGSGKLEEISTSAPVISDIHERHRASAQQARSSCSTGEGATTTKTRRRRTKNIQISSEEESYADLGGTSSRVAQQSRASAYANSERDQPPAEQQQVSSALCNQNEAIPSNLQLEHHRQQEVMSTQSSFVSGSVSDQLAQQQFNHHHQQQQDRPLISAHPIGLGCFGAGQQQQQMEPVPGASDNSIVMTSSGAHSPDDEHESFSPRERAPGGEPRAHQLRHSLGGAQLSSLAAAAAGGDSSQLSLNGAGNAGPGKSFLGKLVGKKASRFRELVLQNLGKADRTQDELFDLYEINFYKQQQQVARLTKEFKLYSTALKSYHEASKSLNKCIQQATTDYQSARHDLVCENLTHLEQLNEDLMEKLQEQVMRSVGEYLSKFEETKEKISKRHRKLIDYDSSRRLYELMLANVTKKRSRQQLQCELSESQQQQHPQNYQSILRGLKFLSQQQQQQQQPQQLQESIASQLVDEARLLKLREQFNYCKLMYENINSELHVELPIVYEKKMKSLLQALQNYYAIKAHYHSNAGKLLSVVSEVIEECPQSINAVLGIARKDSKRRSESSSSTNYDDDDDDSDDVEYGHEPNADKARSLQQQQQHITGGGSSGVGSSRGDSVVDSASSPSSSSSPDCAAVVADSDRNSPSGKAHGPADLTRAEQQFAPECSQSVGELVASADGSPDGAELDQSVDESASVEQVVATGDDETVVTPQKVQSEVTEQPEAPSRQVDNDREQSEANPKEEDNEEVKIKILNTTRPSSAKCEESQVEDEQDSAVAVQGVEERPLLYKVKTNYKYLAEDVDELCFEADEIIQVIEFDENHEPEDGWLLGIREVNNQRGLFPANFTQPI